MDNLISTLQENKHCQVTFTKTDGTIRVMNCSLHSDILPKVEVTINKQKRKLSENVVRVFDLDKKEWRAFKKDTVQEIKIIKENK